ncbi:hypothetical protein CALCODRAFT_488626, partial [Calocera cornea HHB12733]
DYAWASSKAARREANTMFSQAVLAKQRAREEKAQAARDARDKQRSEKARQDAFAAALADANKALDVVDELDSEVEVVEEPAPVRKQPPRDAKGKGPAITSKRRSSTKYRTPEPSAEDEYEQEGESEFEQDDDEDTVARRRNARDLQIKKERVEANVRREEDARKPSQKKRQAKKPRAPFVPTLPVNRHKCGNCLAHDRECHGGTQYKVFTVTLGLTEDVKEHDPSFQGRICEECVYHRDNSCTFLRANAKRGRTVKKTSADAGPVDPAPYRWMEDVYGHDDYVNSNLFFVEQSMSVEDAFQYFGEELRRLRTIMAGMSWSCMAELKARSQGSGRRSGDRMKIFVPTYDPRRFKDSQAVYRMNAFTHNSVSPAPFTLPLPEVTTRSAQMGLLDFPTTRVVERVTRSPSPEIREASPLSEEEAPPLKKKKSTRRPSDE